MAERLRREVEAVRTLLLSRLAGGGPDIVGLDAAGEDDLRRVAAMVAQQVAGQLDEITEGRIGDLESFNIVLFGRTGAGKSSLREAMSCGDGGSISPWGAADWTTDVDPTPWQSCQIIDTPGIAGWGRTVARSELEDRARRALIAADVVVLCFDSQSQQSAEFEKVAAWIAAYDKPAIALLNNRNPMWRFPSRVPTGKARRTLSLAVRQHAENIRDELTRIRLPGVPVIAVNTKRAVFANASMPYEGPDEETLHRHRTEAGDSATLLEWSNVPALELLLDTAIGRDAVGLRLGGLTGQLAGAYAAAEQTISAQIEEPAVAVAAQAEIGIERMLSVLGLPEVDPNSPDEQYAKLLAAVARLEALRGGGFEVPVVGDTERFADHVIRAALAPEREASQRRSDSVIDRAIADGHTVSSERFAEQVFDTEAIQAAATTALRDVAGHLGRRVDLIVGDVEADLAAVAAVGVTVEGGAGRTMKRVGIATGFAGAASGTTAGVLAAIMLSQSWNPVGWTIAGVLLTGSAASFLGNLISGWLRRHSRRRREEALARARGEARLAVTEFFEQARSSMARQVGGMVRRGLLENVGAAVGDAVRFRELAEAASEVRQAISDAGSQLPQVGAPVQILRDAAAECEAGTGLVGQAAAAHLWLGESWCDEEGVRDVGDGDGDGDLPRPADAVDLAQPDFPAWAERTAAGALAAPLAGSGRAWLARAQSELAGDPRAEGVLAELGAIAADSRPLVLICGDYNTGKSSFIRRILLDAGQEPPEALSVAGAPETADVSFHDWAGLRLVDSPGFQSGREEHSETARRMVPDAAAVVYLFSPNIVTGDQTDLGAVLSGDPADGSLGKFARTVLVLNRSDQIGPDPFDAPEQFVTACGRKRTELALALGANERLKEAGVRAEPDQVLCTASDPYGFQGDAAEQFDKYRRWDGMDHFYDAFAHLRRVLLANGVDTSLLHGGIARLTRMVRAAEKDAADEAARRAQLAALRADVADQKAEGTAIRHAREERLKHVVGEFLERGLSEAMRSKNAAERRTLAEQLEFWTKNREVLGLAGMWRAETQSEVEAWERKTAKMLERRMESFAFQQTFPDSAEIVSMQFLSGRAKARRKAAARGLGRVGAALGKADETGLARVLDKFGRVLQPGDIAKWSSRLSRAGVVLTTAAGVADFIVLGLNANEDVKVDRLRRSAVLALQRDGESWARQVAYGTPEAPGLLALLDEACEELDAHAAGLDRQIAAHEAAVERIGSRIAAYRELIDAAHRQLSFE